MSLRIRQLRDERKLTQQALADILGLTQQAVYNYENGNTQPDIDTLKAIAAHFDVSVDYLVGHGNIRQSTTEFDLYKLNEAEKEIVDRVRLLSTEYTEILRQLLRLTKTQ